MITKSDPAVTEIEMVAARFDCRQCCFVGSVAINGEGNDLDHLWLVDADKKPAAIEYLTGIGFTHEGEVTYHNGDFESLRRGVINVIITTVPKIYDTWKVAVEICKYVKTKSRDQRVAIHQIIMDGAQHDEVTGEF